MADRSVKVRLEADISGYRAAMSTAAKSTMDFANRANAAGNHALDWAGGHRQSINDLSMGMLGAGAALTAFSAVGIKTAADFDEAMSEVAAATMAPQAELDALRAAALEAGASTKYSATEAADAITQLAKAGVSTSDILNGGLHGALDLAASDNLEVGAAAEIAASAMTQFKLSGKDVTHIADLLAAGAGKAQGGVADLGGALNQSGLVASQFGLSIEETVGALAAFASAGLIGSDAGTSFKTMLQRLADPSKEAQAELDALGISVWDAQGNFVGLADFAGQLQTAMQDLSPEVREAAMATIFGSDAVRAASILYSEGEPGIRDWIAAVDDQGYAAEQAAIKMDNLKGDIEQFMGALETAFIGMGSGEQAPLRDLVQGATDVVNAFNSLPEAAQTALGGTAGILGMSLLAVGGLGKVLVAANDAKSAVQELGLVAKITGNGMRALSVATAAGAAIGVLTWAIGSYIEQAAEAEARSKELASTLDEVSGSATAATQETVIKQLSDQLDKGDWAALEKIGLSQADLARAVLEGGSAYEEATAKLAEWRLAQQGAMADGANAEDAYGKAEDAIIEMNTALGEGRESAQQAAEANAALGGSAEEAAAQQEILQAAVEQTGVTLEGVIDDMQTFLDLLFATGLATMSAREAEAQYQESLAGIGETVQSLNEKYGGLGAALNETATDFNLTTEAGREANAAFQSVASDGMERMRASAEDGAGLPELQGQLDQTYNDLVAAANQMGITGDSADALARDVMGIPAGVDIHTWMDSKAKEMAGETQRALDGVDRSITITTHYVTTGTPPSRSPVPGRAIGSAYAVGGPVVGPGTGTSDSIPAWLSNGEHVWTAAEVAAAGGHQGMYRMRAAVRAGEAAFAVGGAPLDSAAARQMAAWAPYSRGSTQQAPRTSAAAPTLAASFQINGADPAAVARESVTLLRQEVRAQAVNLPGGR